jgi:hypothetical protein
MTPEQFRIKLEQQRTQLAQAINHDLPVAIGKKAVDLFTENFLKEGVQDNSVQRGKEV